MSESKIISIEDQEELAAYLEGGLGPGERARVEERLVRDERYYELFEIALESFSTEEPEVSPAPSEPTAFPTARPSGPRSNTGWLLPLAAGLVLLLGSFLVLRSPGPVDPWATLAEVDLSGLAASHDWSRQSWSLPRGSGTSSSPSQAAFRLGVRLVDLEVAQRGGDRELAVGLSTETVLLGEALGKRSVEEAFRRLRADLLEAEDTDLGGVRASLLAELEGHPGLEPFLFGAQVELRRLLVLAGQLKELRETEALRLPSAFEGNEKAAGLMREIDSLLRTDEVGEVRVRAAYDALIAALAG